MSPEDDEPTAVEPAGCPASTSARPVSTGRPFSPGRRSDQAWSAEILGPVTALPPLARPGRPAVEPVVWTTRRRGPRGLAAGVAAGVVAATALFWSGPASAPPLLGDGARPPVQAGQDGQDWSTGAVVTLASIRTQLQEIDQTTQVWNSEIAPQYQGQATPAPVRAMVARKVVLEQQRAVLSAQLSAAQRFDAAQGELRGLDRQLAAIDAALSSSAPGDTAAGPDSTLAALQSARALAQQSRDAKVAEVARLAAGVRQAQQSPIPDRADQTVRLTQAVLQLDNRAPSPAPTAPSTPSQQPPPALAAGGPDGRRPTAQVTTGQPVAPRSEPLLPQRSGMGPDGQPSDAAAGPRPSVRPGGSPVEAVTGAVTGTVGAVADTAEKVLPAGPGENADKSTGAASPATPQRPVRKVADAATGAVTGTADRVLSPATSAVTSTVDAVTDTAPKLLSPRSTTARQASDRTTADTSTDQKPGSKDDAVAPTKESPVAGNSPDSSTAPSTDPTQAATTTSSTSTSSTRSNPGSDSASRSAQLAYAAELVKGTPAESWAGPAIELARQMQRGSSSQSSTPSDGSSGDASGAGRQSLDDSSSEQGQDGVSGTSSHDDSPRSDNSGSSRGDSESSAGEASW